MGQAVEVTVVICVYNAEGYIEETLQSLVDQTFQAFKVLLIDDCSTDNTQKVAVKFLKHHNFEFEVFQQAENRGLAHARLVAENRVDTEYLYFLDADDVAEPQLIETLYAAISNDPQLVGVSCYASYIDADSKKIQGGMFIGPTSKEMFFEYARNNKLIFMPGKAMFRTKAALEVGGHNVDGFPEGKIRYQDMAEDLELWTRLSDLYKDGRYMVVLPKPLLRYRKLTNSLSAQSVYAMAARMRHVKYNLLRRRAGLGELGYIDYIEALSARQKMGYWLCDRAALYYRKAGHAYLKKKYVEFLFNISLSALLNPKQFLDKFQHNLLGGTK